MGVESMPTSSVQGDSVNLLRAVMLFPTSSEMAREYLALESARALLITAPILLKEAFKPTTVSPKPLMGGKVIKFVAIENEANNVRREEARLRFREKLVDNMAATYAHQPPADFELISKRAAIEGQVAGLCLHMFRVLDRGSYATQGKVRAKPSWRIVRYLCEEYNVGRVRRRAGRPFGGSFELGNLDQKKIKGIWEKYRSVAHLWAAALSFTGDSFPSEPSWTFEVNRLRLWAIAWGYEGLANRLQLTNCRFGHLELQEPSDEDFDGFSKETAEQQLPEEDSIWRTLAENKVAAYRAQ